ncbi:MAG: DoxX family protein [Planctomycetota bacterium]
MRSLLFYPLRFAVGWGVSPRILGAIAIAMLVMLRLMIGWHFFSEGIEKYQQGNWDAAPFFANAKGPFASHFREIVWDHDGKVRRDVEYTRWWFDEYRKKAAEYYGFGEKENNTAEESLDQVLLSLETVLDDYSDDLTQYDLGLERLKAMESEADRTGVSSLAGQIETVRRENDDLKNPVLAKIDKLWQDYEISINALAAPNQREASPPIKLQKPATARIDTSVLNRVVPYFDMIIGWCLLLGLFTPLASLAAAGFLGSVFLSSYPPATGPISSNYQMIECLACLVLASTGAGRFAGVDFFLHLFIRRGVAKSAKS